MEPNFEQEISNFIIIAPELVEKIKLTNEEIGLFNSDFIELNDEPQDNTSTIEENNWKCIFDSQHKNTLLHQNNFLIKNTLLTKRLSKAR